MKPRLNNGSGIEAGINDEMFRSVIIESSNKLQDMQSKLETWSQTVEPPKALKLKETFKALVDASWVVYGTVLANSGANFDMEDKDNFKITDREIESMAYAEECFSKLLNPIRNEDFWPLLAEINKIVFYFKVRKHIPDIQQEKAA